MINEGKISRIFLLGLLAVMLSSAEAANETDALLEQGQEVDLHFETYRNQTNSTADQPAAIVPVSDELAVCGLAWVGSGNGNVPNGAVVGGWTSRGEKMYIGRAYHNDDLLPGKLHPANKALYIPYGGKEYKFTNYEVLVEVRRGFQLTADDDNLNDDD